MPAVAPIEEVNLPWTELIQLLDEGILGKTGLTQKQIVSSCIVDPAGLQFIQHSSPGKAGVLHEQSTNSSRYETGCLSRLPLEKS